MLGESRVTLKFDKNLTESKESQFPTTVDSIFKYIVTFSRNRRHSCGLWIGRQENNLSRASLGTLKSSHTFFLKQDLIMQLRLILNSQVSCFLLCWDYGCVPPHLTSNHAFYYLLKLIFFCY
jgi:hypothetical protein